MAERINPTVFQPAGRDPAPIRFPAAASGLAPNAVIGNTYIIEELLARGGMGEVYRARHIELGTPHAIKVILPHLASDPKIVHLFIEEARKLGRVRNDVVVNYEGFFRDESGLRYLVMEFVDGESLAKILTRCRFDPEQVRHLRDRLAIGLAEAHERGIIHRDISPENILLPGGSVDRAKIIDFGIAKSLDPEGETVVGSDFAGKNSFVSPEQAGLFGGEIDHRADIYSLGLVLAAAAIGFGKKLEMGATPQAVITARQSVPDLSAVPASLRPIIAPLLEPQPKDRPASMHAVLQLGKSPQRRRRQDKRDEKNDDDKDEQDDRQKDRKPWYFRLSRIGSAAAAVVVLVGGAMLLAHYLRPPPSEAELRGRLAAATAGYQCAALDFTLDTNRAARVSGFAGTADDLARLRRSVDAIRGIDTLSFNVAVREWPQCAVFALLQPLLGTSGGGAPRLALASDNGDARIGQRLRVAVRAPHFDGYLYVDYFNAAGQVLHLLPNDQNFVNLRPARNMFILGEGRPPMTQCWTLGGKTGDQLITLVATTKPLFTDARAAAETAKQYLPDLTAAIQNQRGGTVVSAILPFELKGASPTPAAPADQCPPG